MKYLALILLAILILGSAGGIMGNNNGNENENLWIYYTAGIAVVFGISVAIIYRFRKR